MNRPRNARGGFWLSILSVGLIVVSSTSPSLADDSVLSTTLERAVTYSGSELTPKNMFVAASDCVGTDFCMFVGESSNQYAEIAFGNPRNFAEMKTIRFGTKGEFKGVTCLTKAWCAVIGTEWWAPILISGDPETFGDGNLLEFKRIDDDWIDVTSITCLTLTTCIAAGNTYDENGNQKPIYFTGDPKNWATTRYVTANIPNGYNVGGQLVQCLSLSYCVLAGSLFKGRVGGAFTWSGSYSVFENARTAAVATQTVSDSIRSISGLWCYKVDSCILAGEPMKGRWRNAVFKGSPKGWKILELNLANRGFGGMDCLAVNRCSALVGNESGGKRSAYAYSLSDPESWEKTRPTDITRFVSDENNASLTCTSAACYLSGVAPDNSFRMLAAPLGNFASATSQPTLENLGYQNQINLVGLDCSSDTSCVAVGSYYQNRSYVSFSSVFNPNDWGSAVITPLNEKIELDPNPNPDIVSSLRSVSCVDSTFCVAVGSSAEVKPSIAVGNPTNWKLKIFSDFKFAGSLGYINCLTKDYCVAIGSAGKEDARGQKLVVLTGNPTTWNTRNAQVITFPNPIKPSGLSCLAKASCVVTFDRMDPANLDAIGAGDYFIGDPATLSNSKLKHLNSVAGINSVNCFSLTSCVAAGSLVTRCNKSNQCDPSQSIGAPRVYLGNPSTWTNQPTSTVIGQNPVTFDALLRGKEVRNNYGFYAYSRPTGFVASDCLSNNECYAVGFDSARNSVVSKIDPTSSSPIEIIQQNLPTGMKKAYFDALSCGVTQCFAMGNSDKGTFIVKLAGPAK